jgi:uncharacterized membrane protein YdjX (TVP38/TMEM64 family)
MAGSFEDFFDNSCPPMSKAEIAKSRVQIKVLTVLLTAISILLILYTLFNLQTLQNEFSAQVDYYGIPGLVVLSFFLELIPQLVSPIAILIAGVFAGVNVHLAILATIFGSTFGSILGFYLGKKYVCKALNVMANRRAISKITNLTNDYGKIIIPIAAVSPLPYMPVVFGSMNFSKKNFLFYALIPRIIGLVFYGYLALLI